jgi:hypothetical protein
MPKKVVMEINGLTFITKAEICSEKYMFFMNFFFGPVLDAFGQKPRPYDRQFFPVNHFFLAGGAGFELFCRIFGRLTTVELGPWVKKTSTVYERMVVLSYNIQYTLVNYSKGLGTRAGHAGLDISSLWCLTLIVITQINKIWYICT